MNEGRFEAVSTEGDVLWAFPVPAYLLTEEAIEKGFHFDPGQVVVEGNGCPVSFRVIAPDGRVRAGLIGTERGGVFTPNGTTFKAGETISGRFASRDLKAEGE